MLKALKENKALLVLKALLVQWVPKGIRVILVLRDPKASKV